MTDAVTVFDRMDDADAEDDFVLVRDPLSLRRALPLAEVVTEFLTEREALEDVEGDLDAIGTLDLVVVTLELLV